MDLDFLLQDFDEIITERGKTYFDKNRVTELEETSPGEFVATVKGSEDYTVTVTLSDDRCADYSCDCPYWNAPYCKHTVAVLFAIQNRCLRTKGRKTNRQRAIDPLSTEALHAFSPGFLISLLQEAAGAFPEVNSWLRARVSPKEDDIKTYRQLIRISIRNHMESGFVSYRHMPAALRGAERALEHIEEMISAHSFSHTLDFALMVIEEVMKLLECGDDSDGQVGSVIEGCLGHIDVLYENWVSHQDKEKQTVFFHRLMTAAESSLFQGWDHWNECLIDICVKIADHFPSLRPPIMALQERDMEISNGEECYSRRYARENAQKAYFEMLKRWGGEEHALQFAFCHMESDDLRLQVFLSHLERKQFQEALSLCLKGEESAENYHGIAKRWKERRYEVYGRMNDIDSQRTLGEELLLDGQKEYYDKLKPLYSAGEWMEKREKLLECLKSSEPLHYAYLQIIMQEEDRPRILAYVQKFPHSIFSLYTYLLSDYKNEVHTLFRKALLHNASSAFERNAYQNVCKQIISYGRTCGVGLAKDMILELQASYPRKPAFQDELRAALEKICRGKSK